MWGDVGGLGSGRDWSTKKKTTARCLRLDIRRLWRYNLLKAGQAFTVRWSRRAEVRGSISISVEENVIILGHDRLQSVLELNNAYRGTALVLGDVVEADDDYTGQHCKGVVGLALAVYVFALFFVGSFVTSAVNKYGPRLTGTPS